MPTFTGTNGNDTLDQSTSADPTVVNTIYGLGNDDVIIGGGAFGPTFLVDDLIFGGDGDDSIASNYGSDTIYGGAGDDTLDSSTQVNPTQPFFDGDPLIATGESDGAGGFTPMVQTFYGGIGNDSIFGYEGDDTIYGGAGNDIISSNFARLSPTPGGDLVYGDAGDDIIISTGRDGVTESSVGDTVYGGIGNDSILGAIESANDGQDDDFLFGGGGNDTIDGNGGTDSIDAGAGDDLVLANGGEDSTDGGAGIDTIDFTNDSGAVNFDMASGSTTITGLTPVESNVNYENAIGTNAADTIIGSDADNSIAGGGGADLLQGGLGNDTLNSGAGDDSLVGGEDPGDGDIDVIDYSGETNGVTVRYTGDEAGTAQGTSTGVDTFSEIEGIVFSDADDLVVATNDTVGVTLDTGAGNDFVESGQGNDSLDGGADIDTLSFDDSAAPVTINIGAGTATGTGIGNDTFQNFENFTLTDNDDIVTGSTGAETVNTGGGEDVVDTQGGNDVINTGDDNDTITVSSDGDDVITVNGGGTAPGAAPGDNDTIIVSNVPPGGSWTVSFTDPDEEDGVVTIFDGPNGTGNVVGTINFNEVENIVCFTRDTMIQTPDGEKQIQDLAEGDLVMTRDHGAQPLRWIGSRTMKAAGKLAPVVIAEGALGNDRELKVSQLHRMLISDWRAELMFDQPEVLAAAKHLVNGDTIYVAEGGEVEYFHMLFDQHEIVTANGAASESFHPGEQGMSWLEEEIREEIFAIFPELRDDAATYGPAARTSLRAWEARALKR